MDAAWAAAILASVAIFTIFYCYLKFGNPLTSLRRWIFKRTFVLGQHHIEVDKKDIASGKTDAVRECLEKQCAGLTSNQKIGGLTTEETLVLSLLQHYSSCYWLNSLDYASLIVMKGFDWLEESTWNKFRATIVCHKQSKSITIRQVVQLLKKFQRFCAQQHPKSYDSEIICFGFYKSSSNFSRPENPATSSPHPTHYLWYDKNKKCFDAITCLSNFYRDTASYWECLMLRAENCLDQYFQQEFVALSDEALEVRLVQFSDEVKSIGITFDSFKQQFKKWKIGNEFDHLVLDMDHCIRWPDEDSKDSALAWCEQLWQLTARCLTRQFEQNFIDRKRKIEMNRRVRNREIDKIRENVERLKSDIAKAHQRKSETDKLVADESQLFGKLAWNHLLLDLANPGFVPDYNLACQRQDHEIYQEKNASQLALKIFALIHPPSPANQEKRAALEKYVKNQSNKKQVLKELHSALDNYVGREISNGIPRNRVLSIDGEASVVLKKIASSVELGGLRKIVINAERVVYVDCDWTVPGISVTLSAPLIRVVSAPDVEKRTITTSGRDGKEHESPKAVDGNGAGASGSHGQAGQDGEDAGNVKIDCQSFIGRLKIVAHGGKGADGQDGGDGHPGLKGQDGADGTFPNEPREGYYSYLCAKLRGIMLLYKSDGLPGKPGGNGGSGGNSGKSGRGGLGGQVHFVASHHDRPTDSSQFIERDCADGQNCDDGQPGRGAPGGTGGKDGQDAVLYFEPNDLWPLVNLTGHWRSHKGSITLKTITFMEWDNNIIIGYKIDSNCPPILKLQAVDGQNGIDGKKAANHLQLRSSNATAGETASQFHRRRQTGKQDDGEQEWERRLEARRSGERQQAEEAESIDRMSRDIVGEQNAISHHEIALAIDRQRLEHMNEIRQRVLSKIQEIFEQRIVHQSVVGQRITRQQKLNFKDDELVLAAASSSVSSTADSERNVRSGRPVPEQSTAALRCLANVDDLIKSHDNKIVLTISQTVQSLVLNLSFDDHEIEWNSIGKIVTQNSEGCDPLKWVDSLEFIASNLPLIISLADQTPASCNLIQVLEKFLTAEDAAEMKDVICVLNEFHQHQRPITVQQVLALLSDISDWTQQSNILLGLFFDKWMLSSITKTIFEVSGGNEELGQSRASLFTTIWLQCSLVSKKWTKSTAVVQSLAENEWFQHVGQFVSQLENSTAVDENSILVDELLLTFARDRLGITRNVSEINVEKRWQLFFVVDHFQPKVDEMDAIGQWARKHIDQQLMAYVERAFNERFIAPLWSEIQSPIQNLHCTKDPQNRKTHQDVEKAIRRLQTASVSSFTSFSFGQKLELSRAVKEKLELFERHRDSDQVDQRAFLYLIKSYSEKAEASTAELFVSSQSDCDDQAEIILSLLADSKKFEKKKVMLELHFRMSHLTDASFEPSQIVKIAGILLNESSDHDDFNNYHWQCFRSIFLENWSNYFFLRWSKCHQQAEHLRDVIAGRNPEEDDRSLNTLELALERYLLFTTGLPPLEAVEKWRQLQELSSLQDRIKFIANDLEPIIQEIKSTITPRINQLYSCKLLHLTETEKYFFKDIVGLMDLLLKIISGAPVSFYDDTHSVRLLLEVIEAVQLLMDLTDDEFQNSQVMSPAKLGEWKKKLVQWKVIDLEAASVVHLAVKELFEAVESRSSSGEAGTN